MRLFAALAIYLFCTPAFADSIQVQLGGNVPGGFQPSVIWYDSGNCNPPCPVTDFQRVKFRQAESGVYFRNFEIPADGTRLCFTLGHSSAIAKIDMYMKKGRKRTDTARSSKLGGIEKDGSAGCTDWKTDVRDMKFVVVTLK